MTSFEHEDYLCEDCHYPLDGYGLCLLGEGWRYTGLDNTTNDDPCKRIKRMREELIAAGIKTEQEFIDAGNQYIEELKAMEG